MEKPDGSKRPRRPSRLARWAQKLRRSSSQSTAQMRSMAQQVNKELKGEPSENTTQTPPAAQQANEEPREEHNNESIASTNNSEMSLMIAIGTVQSRRPTIQHVPSGIQATIAELDSVSQLTLVSNFSNPSVAEIPHVARHVAEPAIRTRRISRFIEGVETAFDPRRSWNSSGTTASQLVDEPISEREEFLDTFTQPGTADNSAVPQVYWSLSVRNTEDIVHAGPSGTQSRRSFSARIIEEDTAQNSPADTQAYGSLSIDNTESGAHTSPPPVTPTISSLSARRRPPPLQLTLTGTSLNVPETVRPRHAYSSLNLSSPSPSVNEAIRSGQAVQELRMWVRSFSLPERVRPGVAWLPPTTEQAMAEHGTFSASVSTENGSEGDSTPRASAPDTPTRDTMPFPRLEDYTPSVYSSTEDVFGLLVRPPPARRGYTAVIDEVDEVVDMYGGLGGAEAAAPLVDVVDRGQENVFPLRRESLRRDGGRVVEGYRRLVMEPF
ncbi:hypothetical protein NA57DRAFT_79467 [Rhizodiscina lignyota]|uniref:Uncharacterized protein n=1 Tax=Rhizodiscina lignyota TaxID=1504668 RepID=A0A9P4M3I2_9PEZI|nr:hypothetical protein NA57DRAFT_79467 [Rhizodiscina lignyota]